MYHLCLSWKIIFCLPPCAADHGLLLSPPLFLVKQKRSSWEKFLSLPSGWENVGLSPGWENRTDIFFLAARWLLLISANSASDWRGIFLCVRTWTTLRTWTWLSLVLVVRWSPKYNVKSLWSRTVTGFLASTLFSLHTQWAAKREISCSEIHGILMEGNRNSPGGRWGTCPKTATGPARCRFGVGTVESLSGLATCTVTLCSNVPLCNTSRTL